jgi:short-subunit dehydrogenase
MLKQNNRSHILNTASAAGLISTAGMAAYNASKHGVVTLSETLYQELLDIDAPIGVSILCPAWVPTQIHESSRNRLEKFGTQDCLKSDGSKLYEEQMVNAVNSGKLSAQQIAALSFSGIINNDLYIIPHQKINTLIEQRTMRMIQK